MLEQKSLDGTAKVGDIIWSRAAEHAAYLHDSEVLTTWRSKELPPNRYARIIAGMYPCVVGFNRALIRSVAKLDNVQDSDLVRNLAEQMIEEQDHNQLWRVMMESFEVDHNGLYSRLRQYLSRYTTAELNEKTAAVVEAVLKDRENSSPGIFDGPPVPEPAVALYHHMFTVADDPSYSFWCHFGSQSAIESLLYDFTSNSIYPGTAGNPALDKGPRTVAWWKEHARTSGDINEPTTEEKHLYLSRRALNRSPIANDDAEAVLRAVDASLHLFAAASLAHCIGRPSCVCEDILPLACRLG